MESYRDYYDFYPRLSLGDWCQNNFGEFVEDTIIGQCQLNSEEMYHRHGIDPKDVSVWTDRFLTFYHICRARGRACYYGHNDTEQWIPISNAHDLYKLCYAEYGCGSIVAAPFLLDDAVNTNALYSGKSGSYADEEIIETYKNSDIRANQEEEEELDAAAARLYANSVSAPRTINSEDTTMSNTAPWQRATRSSKYNLDPYLVVLPNRNTDAPSDYRSQARANSSWRSKSDNPQQSDGIVKDDPRASTPQVKGPSMNTSRLLLGNRIKTLRSTATAPSAIASALPAVIDQSGGSSITPSAPTSGSTDVVDPSITRTRAYLDQLLQPDVLSEELLHFLVAVDKKWDVMAVLRGRDIEPGDVATGYEARQTWARYVYRLGSEQGRNAVLGSMRHACNGKPSSTLIRYVDVKFGIETFGSEEESVEDSS